MWNIAYGYSFLICLVLSVVLSGVSRFVALRLGFLDQPGGRKGHKNAVPLLGGAAIYLSLWIFLFIHLLLLFRFTSHLPEMGWNLPGKKEAGNGE